MIIEWWRFSWKSSQWKPWFTEGRIWSCAINLCSFLPSLAIFYTGDGHKWLLSGGDFRENRRSESHSLLKGVYEVVPSIYTVFFRVWQYSVQEMATNDYWVVSIFVKIVAVKAMVYRRAYMKLCHQFIQFSSEFGNIWYKRWPQMIIEWWRFSWKSSQWKP